MISLTEDEMFLAIFNYLDHVFVKINPKKTLFIAIDGVAPRAKMNQQRSRRFRSAQDAQAERQRAIAAGEQVKEDPFDSNCITPGTSFMVRLQEQLKFFISKKITEDSRWREIRVILSGHEVPGEGEHKIMEFIRYSKSLPDYDHNTRHCLYGLDADLIMLGLLAHEPHFALLREEVVFSKRKVANAVELKKFFLLHLSLFREYLEEDFKSLKKDLKFEYDVERIIDDFIILAYFIGNDFLPNLPGLHINEGAMSLMFKVYKEILITLSGYINENGQINFERLQVFVDRLSMFEKEKFVETLEGGNEVPAMTAQEKKANDGVLLISKSQRRIFKAIKKFVLYSEFGDNFTISSSISLGDKVFLQNIAAKLKLSHNIDDDLKPSDPIVVQWEDEEAYEDDEELPNRAAILRLWDEAKIVETIDGVVKKSQKSIDTEFDQWKNEYYKSKFKNNSPEFVEKIAYDYVEGLNWVANYYYNGVPSWGWFYPYHYSPKISDLKNLAKMKFKLDKGKPFLPFEQLMGVLPSASSKLVPAAYRDLMVDNESSIIDFYPQQFLLDKNGKKQAWEAIVLIPFIDEKRLIKALDSCEKLLSDEERQRNKHGVAIEFTVDEKSTARYPSTIPKYIPDINVCKSVMKPLSIPELPLSKIVRGILPGCKFGKSTVTGFPSLSTINHTSEVKNVEVKVFEYPSKAPSIYLTLENKFRGNSTEEIAEKLLKKHVYVGWPYFHEAIIDVVLDNTNQYSKEKKNITKSGHNDKRTFDKNASEIKSRYESQFAVNVKKVDVIAYVRLFIGMKLKDDGSTVKLWTPKSLRTPVAVQTIVDNSDFVDKRFIQTSPEKVADAFPIGASVFCLANTFYGHRCTVSAVDGDKVDVVLEKSPITSILPELEKVPDFVRQLEEKKDWITVPALARLLDCSIGAVSTLTSSFRVVCESTDQFWQIGLGVKFERKNLCAIEYAKKDPATNNWLYSSTTHKILAEYKKQFPEIFSAIGKNNKGDFFKDTSFYKPNVATESMNKVANFVKDLGLSQVTLVNATVSTLDRDSVLEIQKYVDNIYEKTVISTSKKTIRYKGVSRGCLLDPATCAIRLQDQKFSIGDRVITVADFGVVPMNLRGTVVGVDEMFIEVLFDRLIPSGNTLGGKCDIMRGLIVNKNILLNLSYKQPPINIKGIKTEEASSAQLISSNDKNQNYRKSDSKKSNKKENKGINPDKPSLYKSFQSEESGVKGASGSKNSKPTTSKFVPAIPPTDPAWKKSIPQSVKKSSKTSSPKHKK